MPTTSEMLRPVHRLVHLPVLGALAVMWLSLAAFTMFERGILLERAQNQLGLTVQTLADFNEIAEQAGGDVAVRGSESRSAAIWRALLQYPTASIWVDTAGAITAGEPPEGDLAGFVHATDARGEVSVHAALPAADALADWRTGAWQRSGALFLVSCGFLLLARFLVRALEQRALAESEAAAARERVSQLALYREQLEQTVAERTVELKDSHDRLAAELSERRVIESELREHDALLNVVTKGAAELLGVQQEDAINSVLEMVGQTVGVSRVQLCRIETGTDGHLHSSVHHEWCAPGVASVIDDPRLQNFDLTANLPRTVAPALTGGSAAFFVHDMTGTFVGLFERAQMRSFLQIPVMVEGRLWGSLNFIDSASEKRQWSWAESDTLKTLAGLMGVAMARARYIRELADANMIVQNSPTILYRLRGEPTFPLIYVSHNVHKFGHDPGTLVGNPEWAAAIIEEDDRAKVAKAMSRALDRDAQAATIEFRLRTGDGGVRWVENRYTPVRDREGRLLEVEGIIIDITERKAAEEKIAQLARTDGLTGLANRTTFTERLRQAFAASRRGAAPFAVLYIDLDHFKDVNDTLGHPAGDELLREVSRRLKSLARETDVIARLGGDEFAILQMDIAEPAHAGQLAGKIVKLLSQPYSLDGSEVNVVSASIGICPYGESCASPDTMLSQADLALYRSKDEGRNQYHFHSDDLDREVNDRVAIAEDLRKALDRDEIELHYQPQVDLVSGRIVGMEALARWQHPARGLLTAAAFMPMAERSGLMPALGRRVLELACRQMSFWKTSGVAPPVMAINLSLSQLKSSHELVRAVIEVTAHWGIAPADLEFDVTEETLAHATLTQNDVLMQLRAIGARIAIDDFGTEYSSFEYLRAYDVSHLKIAQAFINNASADPERAAMVRAIMNIARELQIGVIAEGVETEEQRAMLVSAGSTSEAQGFYFSEAVTADRAQQLLNEGSVKPAPDAVPGRDSISVHTGRRN